MLNSVMKHVPVDELPVGISLCFENLSNVIY